MSLSPLRRARRLAEGIMALLAVVSGIALTSHAPARADTASATTATTAWRTATDQSHPMPRAPWRLRRSGTRKTSAAARRCRATCGSSTLATGDLPFLKKAFPFMEATAQFLLAYQQVGADGLLHAVANAHETQWAVQDPTTDIAPAGGRRAAEAGEGLALTRCRYGVLITKGVCRCLAIRVRNIRRPTLEESRCAC